MTDINLSEAFAQYGAKLVNHQWAVSAISEDGALVMSCWAHYFRKHFGDAEHFGDGTFWGRSVPSVLSLD